MSGSCCRHNDYNRSVGSHVSQHHFARVRGADPVLISIYGRNNIARRLTVQYEDRTVRPGPDNDLINPILIEIAEGDAADEINRWKLPDDGLGAPVRAIVPVRENVVVCRLDGDPVHE